MTTMSDATSTINIKSTPDSSTHSASSIAPLTALPTHMPGMPQVELPSGSHRPIGGMGQQGRGTHGSTGLPLPHQRLQPPLSPHHHTRSTALGIPSPIHDGTRLRSHSTGNYPYPLGILSSPAALPNTTMSPYSVRSLPASPLGAPPQFQPTLAADQGSGGGGGLDIPFLPSQQVPPEHSTTHKAMEAAAVKERARTKQLEEEEQDLDVDELRKVLKRERSRMCRIASDLAAMKSTAVQSQLEAEVIEEGRINCLMRRLETVQQEKGRIIVELEQEEEMLTNTLQKKLDEVRREKALLQEQIEHEKKSHATLQTQLSGLRDSHLTVAEALEEEEEMEEEA